MREDIRKKKYKMLYKKVEDMYCNEFKNITECCKANKITPSQYYKICNELDKKSVNVNIKTKKNDNKSTKNNTLSDDREVNGSIPQYSAQPKMNSKRKVTKNVNNQKGGEGKNISDINIDEYDINDHTTKELDTIETLISNRSARRGKNAN